MLFHLLASVIGCEYREMDFNRTVIVVHRRVCGIHIFFTDYVEISMVSSIAASNIGCKKYKHCPNCYRSSVNRNFYRSFVNLNKFLQKFSES